MFRINKLDKQQAKAGMLQCRTKMNPKLDDIKLGDMRITFWIVFLCPMCPILASTYQPPPLGKDQVLNLVKDINILRSILILILTSKTWLLPR